MYLGWHITIWMTWVDVWAYIASAGDAPPKIGTVRASDRSRAQTAVIDLLKAAL